MAANSKNMTEIINNLKEDLIIDVRIKDVDGDAKHKIYDPLKDISETIKKLYVSFENSAVARHSDSPLETLQKKTTRRKYKFSSSSTI